MQTAPSDASIAPDRAPLLVDLALQGGGSHGAYTWGVLDRLLEEPWLRIEAISGTSAGAMNAAALAYGFSLDESRGARLALEGFWRRVSQVVNSAQSSAGRSTCFSAVGRSTVPRPTSRWI